MKARQRGSVLLELVLLVPMMIIVAVCGVEFTRCLRYMKVAQGLSKEVANGVFRECASLRTLRMSSCIHDAQILMTDIAQRIAPGSHTHVTVYVSSAEPANPVPTTYTLFEAHSPDPRRTNDMPTTCRGGNLCSDLPGPLVMGNDWYLVRSHGAVVVGEAFVQYRPLMGPVASLFGYSPRTDKPGEPGYFTDATIL